MNFNKFLNDCFVEHNIGTTYNVVSSLDYDIGIIVDASPLKGWSIKENKFFDIDTEEKRERVYKKIDQFIKENEL